MSGSPRWLGQASNPASRALRQALDEARPSPEDDAFARQRVWPRVQSPWWDRSGKLVGRGEGARARSGGGWLAPLLAGAGVSLVAAVTVLVSAALLRDPGPRVANTPRAEPSAAEVVALPSPSIPLTTGPEDRSRHRLARGVDAELSPRTALVPGDARTAPVVQVGRVRFSVPHQAPGQRYSVRAGAYRVVVLGTTFDVVVDEAGVSVQVASGTVEVQEVASGRVLERLPAGRSWSSARPPAEPPITRREPTRPAFRPVRKPALRQLALARHLGPAATRALERVGDARSEDPSRALIRYQRIAEGGGPMAEVALYTVGEIEQEQLRDLGRAAATWRRYAERYPEGLLRAEADLSLIDALVRLGAPAQALDQARDFLRRHRQSERRGEVARVAGDLARQAGDCAGALDLYDLSLQSRPSPEDADDALFYRAECLVQQRDARSAGAARVYLGRFPLGRHAVEAQRLLRGPDGDGGGP